MGCTAIGKRGILQLNRTKAGEGRNGWKCAGIEGFVLFFKATKCLEGKDAKQARKEWNKPKKVA